MQVFDSFKGQNRISSLISTGISPLELRVVASRRQKFLEQGLVTNSEAKVEGIMSSGLINVLWGDMLSILLSGFLESPFYEYISL